LADASAKDFRRIKPACMATILEPARPGRNVTDLVEINTTQHSSALRIANTLELGCHFRSDVETARFEHERDDGKTGEQIAGGCLSRFPKPVMCGEVAIPRSEIRQPLRQQLKVERFIGGRRRGISRGGRSSGRSGRAGRRGGNAQPTAIAPERQIVASRWLASAFATGSAVARIATAPAAKVGGVVASVFRRRARP
jgi:hypothetical protein